MDQHARQASNYCQMLYGRYIAARRGSGKDQYLRLSLQLEELLLFIQSQFPAYFDQRLPLPFSSFNRLQDTIRNQIRKLTKAASMPGMESGLKAVLLQPYKDFVKHPENGTFQLIDYLTRLSDEFVNIARQPDIDYNFEAHQLLHSFNFNSPFYLRYCAKRIKEKLEEEEKRKGPDVESKLKLFSFYIKTMNQVPVRSKVALHPDLPSIVESNAIWFEQEKLNLEMEILMKKGIFGGININNTAVPKIPVNLSRQQLISFLRALMEMKIINVDNTSAFFPVIAAVFATKGTDDLSRDAIRNSFFNKDQKANDFVREHIFYKGYNHLRDFN
ncbi:hypothetical protein MKQ70_32525 [Chitinophaga sedimenti]|uniref:hypothetical protein n=1 Tax=Chitinophaga sedimenti TaxID=2033606 RepID=UPI002006CC46|nr:hypothetical protein [Chitinophaga sedimenti]MCK7559442.1 hypothetical protein [Chitinophaga sedimenti]